MFEAYEPEVVVDQLMRKRSLSEPVARNLVKTRAFIAQVVMKSIMEVVVETPAILRSRREDAETRKVPDDIKWASYGGMVIKRLVSLGHCLEAAQQLTKERSQRAQDVLEEIMAEPVMINQANVMSIASEVIAGMQKEIDRLKECDTAVGEIHALCDGAGIAPGDVVSRVITLCARRQA